MHGTSLRHLYANSLIVVLGHTGRDGAKITARVLFAGAGLRIAGRCGACLKTDKIGWSWPTRHYALEILFRAKRPPDLCPRGPHRSEQSKPRLLLVWHTCPQVLSRAIIYLTHLFEIAAENASN